MGEACKVTGWDDADGTGEAFQMRAGGYVAQVSRVPERDGGGWSARVARPGGRVEPCRTVFEGERGFDLAKAWCEAVLEGEGFAL